MGAHALAFLLPNDDDLNKCISSTSVYTAPRIRYYVLVESVCSPRWNSGYSAQLLTQRSRVPSWPRCSRFDGSEMVEAHILCDVSACDITPDSLNFLTPFTTMSDNYILVLDDVKNVNALFVFSRHWQ